MNPTNLNEKIEPEVSLPVFEPDNEDYVDFSDLMTRYDSDDVDSDDESDNEDDLEYNT